MFNPSSEDTRQIPRITWSAIEPEYRALAERPLNAGNAAGWLADWTRLAELVNEAYQRLWVATTVDTTNAQSEQQYHTFLDEVYPQAQAAEQALKEKLIASGLEPAGFAVPLRNLRAQAQIFRQENLALLAEELKLSGEYDKIIGAQSVAWEGKELTILQLTPIQQDPERERRERAWRLGAERQLADREAINQVWRQALQVRQQLAANSGLYRDSGQHQRDPDYRAYRWVQLLRFDYTPEDCRRFHQAIETVVVPAAERIYARRKQRLGLPSLRPWDTEVDVTGKPPLRPYRDLQHLEDGVEAIFRRVDPELAGYFAIMRREGLLDLDNRKGKAPGGYCTEFPAARRPFIFMNAVNLHDDVQTLLHEGGHAFHVFETSRLPYIQQKEVGLEFAEVASMSMELLGAPYLTQDQGGFYTPPEAARARVEHLEGIIRFWPYMAVVDAFQHWVYEQPQAASDPASCDASWGELWDRFMPGIDWSGLEPEKATGWQRKAHIHQVPFYYIEYGLAQLGALQVWRNSLTDPAGAVAAYRQALSLGGTAPLPQLYSAAGARLAFDAGTFQEVIDLMEKTIADLEAQHV
jgi:oligoendopeptidase F